MGRDRDRSRYRPGCGCSSFVIVLVLGIICTALGIGVGGGASVKIPFTEANISGGVAVGRKDLTQAALPNYLRYRVADNTNFINHTGTLTVWVGEGMYVAVIGTQPEAPVIDLNITIARESLSP